MAPFKKPKADKNISEQNEDEVNDIPVVSGQLKKKIQKQHTRLQKKRGVVFIKHLPHGFFEQQLENYFKQFGNVTQVRLVRSRRTGGSKGFAFIEFEYPEVAQVAAETMDNYLMFEKLIKATYIPPEKQSFNYFKTQVRKVKNKAGKEIYVSQKTAAITKQVKTKNDWSYENYQKRTTKKLRQLEKLKEKYAHLGIDFTKIVIQPKKVDNNSVETAGETKKKQKALKKDKSIELADLLGSTINEDSEDEDYVALNDTNEIESSDEETYGFTKDSDDDEIEVKKSKKFIRNKPQLKAPKLDTLENLIKRKPHFGGIKKAEKKPIKKSILNKQKNVLTKAAAKEIAEPFHKVAKKVNTKAKNKKQKA